jgi:hypothetical protein
MRGVRGLEHVLCDLAEHPVHQQLAVVLYEAVPQLRYLGPRVRGKVGEALSTAQ